MERILITYLVLLLYGGGFLLWPVFALLWRGKRSTLALRRMFLAQVACNLVLAGFAFSNIQIGKDNWFILWFLLNTLLFTPLAIGAAVCDFIRSQQWTHMSPSEWRNTLCHLRDDYSRRLSDPSLNASRRAEFEWLLKGLRKLS